MNRFLLASLLFFSTASASPIGNPADPSILEEGFWISDCSWSSLRFGITGDFLMNKRLRTSSISHGLGISRPELNWKLAAADLGWNIRERFDLHLLAGPASTVQLRWREDGEEVQASGDQGFFWGASAKLILLEVEDTTLGVDFHGGGIQWIEGPLVVNGAPSPQDFQAHLYFWQIGTGLSQNIGALRPYLGAAINHFVYRFTAIDFKHLRFRDLLAVGMYEGCTISFGSRIFLNIEARQFFESGLAIAGELRF